MVFYSQEETIEENLDLRAIVPGYADREVRASCVDCSFDSFTSIDIDSSPMICSEGIQITSPIQQYNHTLMGGVNKICLFQYQVHNADSDIG